ncbi:MAG: hypothetical protein EBX41_07890 [Chitinophagia bacterium]|nr:hypothetical protein [Chitinophagia bacterium]
MHLKIEQIVQLGILWKLHFALVLWHQQNFLNVLFQLYPTAKMMNMYSNKHNHYNLHQLQK